MEVRIGVTREGERREASLLDDDTQLLLKLADQRSFGPFARLDLAAGELPQAGHRLALGALCEQHASVGVDQGAGSDKNDFHRIRLCETRRFRVKDRSTWWRKLTGNIGYREPDKLRRLREVIAVDSD